MKIAFALLAVLSGGFVTVAATGEANAAVYCRYIGYPKGCIVRPGVVLVARPAPVRVVRPAPVRVVRPVVVAPRPVARPVARTGVPGNRGGPVNRVGRY